MAIPVARLQFRCDGGNELKTRVWWREPSEVPSALSWRVSEQPWRTERWHTPAGWKWNGQEWAVHAAVDAVTFVRHLLWSASAGGTLFVRYEQDGRVQTASFDLADAFETPVQSNLVQCGPDTPLALEEPVLDWGRFGDDFYWGVNDNEDPIETYVVMRTVILQTGTEALLNVECEDGQLGVNLYWKIEDDIDWTVLYWVDDGSAQEEEWIAGRRGR